MSHPSLSTLTLICRAIGTALPAAPIPQGAGKAIYFPTTVGARWEYKWKKGVTTVVVTSVKVKDEVATVTVEEVLADGKRAPYETVLVSRAGIWQSVNCGGVFTHNPPLCWLQNPHKVGDEWAFKGWFGPIGETWVPASGTITVQAVERVTVPAGTFTAVRVEGQGNIAGPWTHKRWYAPGVGLIKLVHGSGDVVELKSFTPGKD